MRQPHNLYVEDNFLSQDECMELIALYNENILNTTKRDNFTYFDVGEDMPIEHDLVQDVWIRQNVLAKKLANAKTHWAQIYEWKRGQRMGLHNDVASKHTMYTSVLYLNHDFEGGETQLEDGTTIVPKQGRIFFYDGISYFHRVRKLESGTRYTIASWYKRI